MIADELGLIRTNLANERTFLAYVRTALAFIATGAGMIHFLPSLVLSLAGGGLLVVGIFIFITGSIRFFKVKRRTKDFYNDETRH